MKKILLIIGGLILVIGVFVGTYFIFKTDEDVNNNTIVKSDAEKFAEEYTLLENDNVFVYKDIKEIINILEKGTGAVYLGFPECPWCQQYVVYLNELAKDNNVEKIYYYDILEDRKSNTEDYQKIVSILKDYLLKDEEGNLRVFVPDITFVVQGKIIGHDNETSLDTKGFKKPTDYWTDSAVKKLKTKLTPYYQEIEAKTCTECNK